MTVWLDPDQVCERLRLFKKNGKPNRARLYQLPIPCKVLGAQTRRYSEDEIEEFMRDTKLQIRRVE